MTYLLDTNVLSAVMSPKGDRWVAAWMSTRKPAEMFTAAVCQAEIAAGLAIMPAGRRRDQLLMAAHAMFAEDFEGRVLPFDSDAAVAYAELFAMRRHAGRPAATMDLMIAAIAVTREAAVVTRNVADFEGCGVELINPWDIAAL